MLRDAAHILLLVMKIIGGTAITIFTIFGIVYFFSSPDRRKTLWAKFKSVTHQIGVFNSRVILSFFYWTVFAVYSIVANPFMDSMRIKKKGTWIARRTTDLTLEDSRRQF
jgi:hypothetical protein